MRQVNKIVHDYQDLHRLSLRKFADALNEKLINTDVSHATVARWKDEYKPSEPDVRFLFECIATYEDWRAHFALECLKAMFPDLVARGVVTFKLPLAG